MNLRFIDTPKIRPKVVDFMVKQNYPQPFGLPRKSVSITIIEVKRTIKDASLATRQMLEYMRRVRLTTNRLPTFEGWVVFPAKAQKFLLNGVNDESPITYQAFETSFDIDCMGCVLFRSLASIAVSRWNSSTGSTEELPDILEDGFGSDENDEDGLGSDENDEDGLGSFENDEDGLGSVESGEDADEIVALVLPSDGY